jgi:hypothetical protein
MSLARTPWAQIMLHGWRIGGPVDGAAAVRSLLSEEVGWVTQIFCRRPESSAMSATTMHLAIAPVPSPRCGRQPGRRGHPGAPPSAAPI